jgi:hypothetical protein
VLQQVVFVVEVRVKRRPAHKGFAAQIVHRNFVKVAAPQQRQHRQDQRFVRLDDAQVLFSEVAGSEVVGHFDTHRKLSDNL